MAATTLYAAIGRLIPFNSNSPTGSTFTAFPTFIDTRGLMKIWLGFASSQGDIGHRADGDIVEASLALPKGQRGTTAGSVSVLSKAARIAEKRA